MQIVGFIITHYNSCRSDYEVLGWASAQIVCLCTVNSCTVLGVNNPMFQSQTGNVTVNNTSLSPSRGECGVVIFSSKPKILVCDLTLNLGDCATCEY